MPVFHFIRQGESIQKFIDYFTVTADNEQEARKELAANGDIWQTDCEIVGMTSEYEDFQSTKEKRFLG